MLFCDLLRFDLGLFQQWWPLHPKQQTHEDPYFHDHPDFDGHSNFHKNPIGNDHSYFNENFLGQSKPLQHAYFDPDRHCDRNIHRDLDPHIHVLLDGDSRLDIDSHGNPDLDRDINFDRRFDRDLHFDLHGNDCFYAYPIAHLGEDRFHQWKGRQPGDI